jgi:hypothetical protein
MLQRRGPPGHSRGPGQLSSSGGTAAGSGGGRPPAAPAGPRRPPPRAPCPPPGRRGRRPRRRCQQQRRPRRLPVEAHRAHRLPRQLVRPRMLRTRTPRGVGVHPGPARAAGCRRRAPARARPSRPGRRCGRTTTPVVDDLSRGHDDHHRHDDGRDDGAEQPHPAGHGRDGRREAVRSRLHGGSTSAGGAGAAGRVPGVEITGTAQHEAWQARALPPVERLRADLWSIPVPIPHGRCATSASTPSRSTAAASGCSTPAGRATRAGRRSPTGWPRSAAVADVRGVLVTHLHFDHLGLAAGSARPAAPWVAMHPADARSSARR